MIGFFLYSAVPGCFVYAQEVDEKSGLSLLEQQQASIIEMARTLVVEAEANTIITERQKTFVLKALFLVGKKSLRFDSRYFPWDCSGTVLSALYLAGIDAQVPYSFASGNGVKRLYTLARGQTLLHNLPLPQLGDVIFWDNTYDYNGDKLWNDELTHVGVVVAVQANGDITYVHHDYTRGITLARMNLFTPAAGFREGEQSARVEVNSALRMKSQEYLRPGVKYSGQLFHSFGSLWDFVPGGDK